MHARILAILVLLVPFTALAHDADGNPNWITHGEYTGRDGVHCCGERDCEVINPERVKATPGGYVLLDFKNELVPYSQATPSEDGKFWRCHTYIINHSYGDGVSTQEGGERRCFFAPVGTQ